MKNLKWWHWILIIFGLFIAIGIFAPEPEMDTETTVNNSLEDKGDTKIETPQSVWSYSEKEDEMDGTKKYFARTKSVNDIEFDFPYNGGSTFILAVRNLGKGNEVVISVDKGQFMTSIMGDETVRIKFDDGTASKYSYSGAADASMDVVFINSSSKFIKKLSNAKKLKVEASFFNEGTRIIEFDVEELKWDK